MRLMSQQRAGYKHLFIFSERTFGETIMFWLSFPATSTAFHPNQPLPVSSAVSSVAVSPSLVSFVYPPDPAEALSGKSCAMGGN